MTSFEPTHPAQRLLVRSQRGHYFVPVDTIESVRAAGNYVTVSALGKRHLVRLSMCELERSLDPGRFARVHRSWILNLDLVDLIKPLRCGDYLIELKSGRQVRMSRRYRTRLLTTLT